MKIICVIILSIVSATNLIAEGGTKQRDVDYSKKIVGSWKYHYKVKNGTEVSGVDTNLSTGQVFTKGTIKRPHLGRESWSVRAQWKIKGGFLITVVERCVPSGFSGNGSRYEAKITFSLDNRAFKLDSEEGGGNSIGPAVIHHRVKSQSGKGDI